MGTLCAKHIFLYFINVHAGNPGAKCEYNQKKVSVKEGLKINNKEAGLLCCFVFNLVDFRASLF